MLGDLVLVNGKPWPRMAVSARKYRFRVLNGSNARAYKLALSTGRPLVQIGTEGGLQHRPVPLRSLPISSRERHEVVIDFSEYPVGTQLVLQNLADEGSVSRVMRFDVVRRANDDSAVPAVCVPPRSRSTRRTCPPIPPKRR